jgi:hypothetical protein
VQQVDNIVNKTVIHVLAQPARPDVTAAMSPDVVVLVPPDMAVLPAIVQVLIK